MYQFVTIIERKLLAKIQRRKGPRRFILQAIIDGIKVITKERIYRENILFYISLFINLFLIILLFEFLPISTLYKEINYKLEILVYILISSFNFYTIIYSSLFSNNKFSLQALIRGINQLVSYEINISVILLSFIILTNSYNYIDILLDQIDSFNFFFFPFFLILFISLLAESNRIPFDLLEGESELVAGRLTEYSSLEFSLIYLSEYYILLFNSSFLLLFFFSSSYLSLSFLLLLFFLLLSRALLPRYTYNLIIYINWFILIPLSFSFLFFYSIFLFN